MKNKKTKLQTIYHAFTQDKDELGDWWGIRKELCNSCEDRFNLTGNCKICGCFTNEKTSEESEACAREKYSIEKQLDKPIKWNRRMIETFEDYKFDIRNLNDGVANISIDKDDFIVNYGKIKLNTPTTAKFELTTKEPLKIKNITKSCSCTTVNHKDNVIELTLKLNRGGKANRQAIVHYTTGGKDYTQKFILTAYGA